MRRGEILKYLFPPRPPSYIGGLGHNFSLLSPGGRTPTVKTIDDKMAGGWENITLGDGVRRLLQNTTAGIF